MTDSKQLRLYEYINRPYAAVRDTLLADPHGIFQRATSTAVTRANEIGATLRVELAGIELATDVQLVVASTQESQDPVGHHPVTRIAIAWQAKRHATLFPVLWAELSIYPLSGHETQLDLLGKYHPPLGLVGHALDSLVGHRLAEATVHRFVKDVAAFLSTDIPSTP